MNPSALDALVTANPTADAAAILDLCAADPRTVNPIPLTGTGGLAPFMTSTGMVARLQRSAAAIAGQDQAGADQLNSFVLYVNSPNGSFDTTDLTFSQQADALFSAMITLNAQMPTLGVTPAEQAAIIAMGGGYAVKDATGQDVSDSMARVAAANAVKSRIAALTPLEQANRDRYNANVGKLATLSSGAGPIPATLADLDAMGG